MSATRTLTPRELLAQVNEHRAEAVAELPVLKQEAKDAADRYVKTKRNFGEADDARKAVEDKEREIASWDQKKAELLSKLPRGAKASNGALLGEPGMSWAHVARQLNPAEGGTRVDVPLSTLVTPPAMAGLTTSPSSGLTQGSRFRSDVTELGRDERHVFMAFPVEPVEASDMGVSDYRQTGERTVTGSIERDQTATSEKSKLNITLTAETLPLSQFAVFIDKVPSRLPEAVDTFTDFLSTELAYQVRLGLDAHVLAKIAEAAPTKGEEGGSAMWLKIRNAVKQVRAKGGKPSILAVNPDVAEALDVMTAGAYNLPVFPLGAVGNSSPLFGLNIVEVPGLAKPLLIDPAAALLYLGEARIFSDPYSGMHKNELRLRVEAEALLWVRDVTRLYSIDKAS